MVSTHRFSPQRRQEERVTPLELFFDLVFVAAVTQCTALMAEDPTWTGLGKGLVVLGVLWWAWVGYSWFTSVVDPEDGPVRLAQFAAMGGFLVAALCVPEAFDDLGLTFAIAYGAVRAAHIALFLLASRDDAALRHSVLGLAVSTSIGVGLLVVASQADGTAQALWWLLALVLDMGGPLVIDPTGWRLEPQHFGERHGLVLIIALGESVLAVGATSADVDGRVIVASVAGVAVVVALWWLYFDVITYVATRVLAEEPDVRRRNTLARDGYSLLHFPMVAGIVLVALGLHEVLAHPDEPLPTEPAAALFGGTALYLLAHVAFYRRATGTLKAHRLAVGALLAALTAAGTELDALWALLLAVAVLTALILYENIRFAESRRQIRHDLARGHLAPGTPTP